MILDIFKRRDTIVLGRINRELVLKRSFGLLRWRWQRRFFRKMRLDPARNLNSHIMITGESGAGKSNACKLILKQLAEQGTDFVVLDPHAEYVEYAKEMKASVYDASIHAVNPFDLDGLTERERTAEITALFRRVLHLGEVQASTLHRCIGYTYWVSFQKGITPNIHNLLYTIKVFKRNAKSRIEASTLDGLEKRLIVLAGENFARSVPLARIMQSRSIFSLSSLHGAEAQSLYMESMLRKVYQSVLSGGSSNSKSFYIVIDEAEKLENTPVMARLVAEGRKYKLGVIAIAQRAKALDKEIRSNAATIIAFAQREPEEQNYVANLIAAGTEYNRFLEVRKAMRELPRGWALVQEARERSPKMVKCRRFSAETRDPSGRIMEMAKTVTSKQELIKKLQGEGFSQKETINTVKELVEAGLLKYHVVTEPPYQGTWFIAMPRNSAEHDVMVSLISRYLTENGVRNRVYNNAYGPDVIAYKNAEEVAVEYETGRKVQEDTERMLQNRRRRYQKVLVLKEVEDSENKQ